MRAKFLFDLCAYSGKYAVKGCMSVFLISYINMNLNGQKCIMTCRHMCADSRDKSQIPSINIVASAHSNENLLPPPHQKNPPFPPAPGQSPWRWRPSAGKRAFQVLFDLFSIWLTLHWTCPGRFQNHFSSPLPAYASDVPPRPISIPRSSSVPLHFRNSSAWQWETGAMEEAGQAPPSSPSGEEGARGLPCDC